MSEPVEYAIPVQAIAAALHADHEQAWGPGSSNISAHRRTAERAVEALAAAGLVVVSAEDLAETIRDAETCHHDRGSDAESDARMDRLRAALPNAPARPPVPTQSVVDLAGGEEATGEAQGATEARTASRDDLSKLIDAMSPEEKTLVLEFFAADREEFLFAAGEAKARYERVKGSRAIRLADDLRHRYANAIHYVLYGPASGSTTQRLAATAAHAVLAVRDTELERASGYAERMAEMVIEKDREATQWAERLHKAEAALVHAKALHSRDDSNPHGPWCGTCTTHWPCRTWTALLSAEEQTGDGRG
ncbi:hypothetical protein FHR32_005103 [Streptosporangium album]|uniref:Uncharacterized protein n=1 Tax=Streptosporangium album TaxID=47479 RepID=A0A7W7WB57_9ACTN|nr:hypothetical protein [Streptosporangium album]MBB4940726.1 hypothetical protein [Streptosporangium album]